MQAPQALSAEWRAEAAQYQASANQERLEGDRACAGREDARAEMLLQCATRLDAWFAAAGSPPSPETEPR